MLEEKSMRILFSALCIFMAICSKDLMSQKGVQISATSGPSISKMTSPFLAKDGPRLPVLKEHGKLFFNFVVNLPSETPDVAPTGTWQAFVITPDKRRYSSQVYDITSQPTEFRILVQPPIHYGNYTVVIENINVQNVDGSAFTGSFIDNEVIVTTTFNQKNLSFFVDSAEWQNVFSLNNLPGHAIQGFVVLPPNFIRD